MFTMILLIPYPGSMTDEFIKSLDIYCHFQKIVTTREKKSFEDNMFIFKNEEEWSKEDFEWELIIDKTHYGSVKEDCALIRKNGIGISFFDHEALMELDKSRFNFNIEIITVGIDLDIEILKHVKDFDRRYYNKTFIENLNQHCDIVLHGDLYVIKEVLSSLLYILLNRALLDKKSIEKLVLSKTLLLSASIENIKPASYDLRLADSAWCQGKYITLDEKNPTLTIPKYSYVIVQAIEKADFPRFIAGRFDLKVSLFFKGIILSNAPQVDPGYKGGLFCLLFNTTDIDQGLTRGQHFASIEFHTTTRVTEGYKQQYQGKEKISDFIPENTAISKGGQLYERIEDIRTEWSKFKKYYITITISIFAIIITATFFLVRLYLDINEKKAEVTNIMSTLKEIQIQIKEGLEKGQALPESKHTDKRTENEKEVKK